MGGFGVARACQDASLADCKTQFRLVGSMKEGSIPWIYGVIFTITTECGATFAEYAPVNEPTSLCAHKSRTLAAI